MPVNQDRIILPPYMVQAPIGAALPEPEEESLLTLIAGPARRQVNALNSVIELGSRFAAASMAGGENLRDNLPAFDPFPHVLNTQYQPFADQFTFVRSDGQMRSIMSRIDRDLEDMERLRRAGWWGILAGFVAGTLDPFILIPFTKAATVVRALKFAENAGRFQAPLAAGLVGARAGLFGESAAQLVLATNSHTRDFGDAAVGVTAATVLGAIGGAGLQALSAPVRRRMEDSLRRDLGLVQGGSGDPEKIVTRMEDMIVYIGKGGEAVTAAGVKVKKAFGVEKVIAKLVPPFLKSPQLDMLVNSYSRSARVHTLRLLDSVVLVEGADFLGPSIEARVANRTAELAMLTMRNDEAWLRYRFRMAGKPIPPEGFQVPSKMFSQHGRIAIMGTKDRAQAMAKYFGFSDQPGLLTRQEFSEEVGRAMRIKDVSNIREVQEQAQAWRELFESVLDDMILTRFVPENIRELGPKGAASYFRRVYNRERLIQDESTFKRDLLEPWLHEKITPEEVQKIVRRVPKDDLGRPIMTDEEAIAEAIRGEADNIFQHLIGRGRTPRVSYEAASGVSAGSPFRERGLDIADLRLEPYLMDDVEVVGNMYVRSVVPDLEIAKVYENDPLMGRAFREIEQEYIAWREQFRDNPKMLKKLDRRERRDREQLAGMRDVLRNTYQTDPMSPLSRTTAVSRTITNAMFSGGFMIASIADGAMPIVRMGLVRSMKTYYLPMIKHFGKAPPMSVKEARNLGAGIELSLDARNKTLWAIDDEFVGNRLDRVLSWSNRKTMLVNLMTFWNTFHKTWAGVAHHTNLVELISRWGRGVKLTRQQELELGFLRLHEPIRRRIARMLELPDGVIREKRDVLVPNYAVWPDLEAREALRTAVRAAVDNTILTPSVGDKPLFLSRAAGKTIFQFQSFNMAATDRLLLMTLQQIREGMSQRDAMLLLSTLNGMVGLIGLGMLVEYLKAQGRNRKPAPTTVADWVKAGSDRVGYAGIFSHVYDIIGPRYFGAGRLSNRYVARNLLSSLMGPGVGLAESTAELTTSLARGQFTQRDLNLFRRMMPWNQLFYMRWAVDRLEEDAARRFRVPKKARRGEVRR